MAFVRRLIRIRLGSPVFHRRRFFQGRQIQGSEVKDLAWFRPDGREMTEEDWKNPHARCLGLRLAGDAMDEVDARGQPLEDDTFLILLNAHHEPVAFVVPAHRRGVRWEPLLDTRAPEGAGRARPLRGGGNYTLEGRSLALFRMRRAGAESRRLRAE